MSEHLLPTSYLKTLRLPTMLGEWATVARPCGEKDELPRFKHVHKPHSTARRPLA